MADEEEIPVYTYAGPRAPGEVVDVTAGEEPKVLTKQVELMGLRHTEPAVLGEAKWINGDSYSGSYANGKRSGKGTYTYAAAKPADDEEAAEDKPPVAVYEGAWKAGVKSGIGKMTYSAGAMYHGCFKGGCRHGSGTFYYKNGDVYSGEWVADRKHGMGTYMFKETGAHATGLFDSNKLVEGGFYDKYGNKYIGKFVGTSGSRVGYDLGGKFSLVSEASATVPQDRRLVLYASNTPEPEAFVAMLLPSVVAVKYDFETATSKDLVDAIESAVRKNGSPFKSLCVANHGDRADLPGFAWPISRPVCIKSCGGLTPEAKAVIIALGGAVEDDGRVDLLACSLLQTVEGRKVFDEVQLLTKTHFAASDDLTGSLAAGGDWVMESDGVDIKQLYFGDTSAFMGTFESVGVDPKGKPKGKAGQDDDPYTIDDNVSNIMEGDYVMINRRPCRVDDKPIGKFKFVDATLPEGCYYKLVGHDVFDSKAKLGSQELTKGPTGERLLSSDPVKVPIVKTTWWEVKEIIQDEITPEMPDKHDTFILSNPKQLVSFPAGQPPGTLKLHALGKHATTFIDIITEQLKSIKVEVKVLSACGEHEIIMKDMVRDIKFTNLTTGKTIGDV